MSKLEFGGYPVILIHNDLGTIVKCKGVAGSLDQLEHWLLNHKKNTGEVFYFGIGKGRSEIIREPDNMVRIACLKEDYHTLEIKLNKLIHGISGREHRS